MEGVGDVMPLALLATQTLGSRGARGSSPGASSVGPSSGRHCKRRASRAASSLTAVTPASPTLATC